MTSYPYAVLEADVKEFPKWEAFLKGSSDGNIFQSMEYAHVLERLALKPLLFLLERDGEIIGGLLAFLWFGNSKIPFIRYIRRASSWGGPVIEAPHQEPEMLRLLLKGFEEEAIRRGAFEHSILASSHLDIIRSFGYTPRPLGSSSTFIVDLSKPIGQLWQNLEKRSRWAIRRAEKCRVEVVVDPNESSPIWFHRMHLQTCLRLKTYPYPPSLYEAVWRILRPKGHARFFFAIYNRRPIASALVLMYKKKMWLWGSASLSEYWKAYPNDLIQWEILTRGAQEGFETYDLMGCPSESERDHPEYGLYIFKRGFGGRLSEIGDYVKVFSPFKAFLWRRIGVPTYTNASLLLSRLKAKLKDEDVKFAT